MFAARKGVSAVEVGPAATYVTYSIDTVSRSSYNFSGLSMGSEGATRQILVLVQATSNTSNGYRTLSSVTVGGTAATFICNATRGTQIIGVEYPHCAAYIVSKPTGTTADVAVAFSGAVSRCTVTIYAVYNSSDYVYTTEYAGYGYNISMQLGGTASIGASVAQVVGNNNFTTGGFTAGVTQRLATNPGTVDMLCVGDNQAVPALSNYTVTCGSDSLMNGYIGLVVVFLPAEPAAFNLTISTNQVAPNFATMASGQGWNGTQRLKVTINSGIIVAALSTTQSYPGGLHIVNNGKIYGYRGQEALVEDGAGQPGGTALYTRVPTTITNNGEIRGGGGGGGGGGYAMIYGDYDMVSGGGGSGGRGQGCSPGSTTVVSNQIGGYGGYAELSCPPNDVYWYGTAQGGNGGAGGAWGTAGSNGQTGDAWYVTIEQPGYYGSGGAGGAAGNYLDGFQYACWRALGTLSGPRI